MKVGNKRLIIYYFQEYFFNSDNSSSVSFLNLKIKISKRRGAPPLWKVIYLYMLFFCQHPIYQGQNLSNAF